MGVPGLWDLVNKKASHLSEKKGWSDLQGKRIAIDANGVAYRLFRADLPKEHFYGKFIDLIFDLIEAKAAKIYVVFDGPEEIDLKNAARKKRREASKKTEETKEELENLYTSLCNEREAFEPVPLEWVQNYAPQFSQGVKRRKEKNGDLTEEEKAMSQQEYKEKEIANWTKLDFVASVCDSKAKVGRVSSSDYETLIKVLKKLGVNVITAAGESEPFCCVLNRLGFADWVFSDDGDCFSFGAKTIARTLYVRDATFKSPSEETECFTLYYPEKIAEVLQLKPTDWIKVSSLCQNDYNKDRCNLYGYGFISALKDVVAGKSMKDIVKANYKKSRDKIEKAKLKSKTPEDFGDWSEEEILQRILDIQAYTGAFWMSEDRVEENREMFAWVENCNLKPDWEGFLKFWKEKSPNFYRLPIYAERWKKNINPELEWSSEDVGSVKQIEHVGDEFELNKPVKASTLIGGSRPKNQPDIFPFFTKKQKTSAEPPKSEILSQDSSVETVNVNPEIISSVIVEQ